MHSTAAAQQGSPRGQAPPPAPGELHAVHQAEAMPIASYSVASGAPNADTPGVTQLQRPALHHAYMHLSLQHTRPSSVRQPCSHPPSCRAPLEEAVLALALVQLGLIEPLAAQQGRWCPAACWRLQVTCGAGAGSAWCKWHDYMSHCMLCDVEAWQICRYKQGPVCN